ncbi:hypothetical protein GCM10023167_03880 [Brevibacterium pityocampae]|uniref:Uncharacterized protein n=1 Tax=Brevibacterium pityocampae TaxID=506594 RepID=A0ABP8J2I0_9MICO
MSVNPAEEETESFNEMGRIARGLGMAGMQIKEAGARKREARERTRERAERQEQGAEAEQQRQAQDRHRDEAEAAKVNRPGFVRGLQVPCRRSPARSGGDGRCPRARRVGSCRSRRGDVGG